MNHIMRRYIKMSMNVDAVNSQAVYFRQDSDISGNNEDRLSTKAKSYPEDLRKSRIGNGIAEEAAVYEHGNTVEKKATYSINMKSASDRAGIVEVMKQELMNRQNQLSNIVAQMLSGQAGTSKLADMFAPDRLKNVSAADIAQAKEDVSENGYWGVNQTSQRLFDFACALAGDDVDKMKEMQAAMEKGFDQATKAWGQTLPGICGETMDAANKLFEDYYASHSK